MQNWTSKESEADGYPLMLRYPQRLPLLPYRETHKLLFLVTHKFAFRLANGLPEPAYNDRLAPLDLSLVRLFNDDDGRAVLVETFGGKRNYYYYCREEAQPERRLESVKTKFAQEELSAGRYDDADWSFIRRFDYSFGLWSQTD